jgi:hypothetical protein
MKRWSGDIACPLIVTFRTDHYSAQTESSTSFVQFSLPEISACAINKIVRLRNPKELLRFYDSTS